MEPTETQRVETDSMGPILVAKDRYWGAQTARSLHHFSVANDHMPPPVIRSMPVLKQAAAPLTRAPGTRAAAWGARPATAHLGHFGPVQDPDPLADDAADFLHLP